MKPKVANESGSRQIMYLMVGVGCGLKILVSAVQSRPCPPLFSTSCPFPNSRASAFVPNSGTLRRIPAHSGRRGAEFSPPKFSELRLATTLRWGLLRTLGALNALCVGSA